MGGAVFLESLTARFAVQLVFTDVLVVLVDMIVRMSTEDSAPGREASLPEVTRFSCWVAGRQVPNRGEHEWLLVGVHLDSGG